MTTLTINVTIENRVIRESIVLLDQVKMQLTETDTTSHKEFHKNLRQDVEKTLYNLQIPLILSGSDYISVSVSGTFGPYRLHEVLRYVVVEGSLLLVREL